MKRTIAVDFDGTLCENKFPFIGEANNALIDELIEEQKAGTDLVLFTCRSGEQLDEAVEWCKDHGLVFDAVNENTKERTEKYGNDCRKVSADLYIDDRAFCSSYSEPNVERLKDLASESRSETDDAEKRSEKVNAMQKETRMFTCEMRAEQSAEHGHYITGRPIVFNQETDLGYCREIIDSGALDKTDLKDVRLLVGHNTSMIPLARSRNNNANSTMQLSVVAEGLDMRADLDIENNADSRALYSANKRGDISGMSFMFVVDEDSWEDLDSEKPLRHIRSIARVFEVSAVIFPAYEGTSLESADTDSALESARASLESARKQLAEERAKQEEAERRNALLAELRGETNE